MASHIIEIKLIKTDGEERGVFLQAKPELAQFWKGRYGITHIEVRILAPSGVPECEWDRSAPWQPVWSAPGQASVS